jgi:hypothetical protein
MGNRLVTGCTPFTILAPVVRNGVMTRKAYKDQIFLEVSNKYGPSGAANRTGGTPGPAARTGLSTYTVPGTTVRAQGTIEITGAVNGPTYVVLGPYTLTSGVDFTNAATLATAISGLGGFEASEAAGIVTVLGPYGFLGNNTIFEVRGYSSGSFELIPDSGHLAGGEPFQGPPEAI